jgi:uncharacterized protein
MTTSHARGIKQDVLNDNSVADYLQTYPDFFERNSQLLTKLRLPHVRDGAATVSLVERQVEVLRERNQSLERKLKELVDVARSNDALADRIHRFTRRLLRTTTRAQALAQIEAGLREDFDAYHSVLILPLEKGAAGAPPAEATSHFLREVATDNPIFKSFESLFSNARPRCGQVRDSQRDFLFGSDAAGIGSVALIPLSAMTPPGLLALGSVDRDRFHPGMSVEFLSRMAELIADSLLRS